MRDLDRDFVAEMRAIIDAETAESPGYVAAAVAREIVEKLRATDPFLLTGWLDLQAEQVVRAAIAARDRSIRGRAMATVRAREFGAAAESGDPAQLSKFLGWPVTLAGDVRKPLGQLNHDELIFARDSYTDRARENQMYAQIMDALAERVTDGVVADHFTEAGLRAVFALFT